MADLRGLPSSKEKAASTKHLRKDSQWYSNAFCLHQVKEQDCKYIAFLKDGNLSHLKRASSSVVLLLPCHTALLRALTRGGREGGGDWEM